MRQGLLCAQLRLYGYLVHLWPHYCCCQVMVRLICAMCCTGQHGKVNIDDVCALLTPAGRALPGGLRLGGERVVSKGQMQGLSAYQASILWLLRC
jgi:hypothetical protein